jgi:hypothetical protein
LSLTLKTEASYSSLFQTLQILQYYEGGRPWIIYIYMCVCVYVYVYICTITEHRVVLYYTNLLPFWHVKLKTYFQPVILQEVTENKKYFAVEESCCFASDRQSATWDRLSFNNYRNVLKLAV